MELSEDWIKGETDDDDAASKKIINCMKEVNKYSGKKSIIQNIKINEIVATI